LGGGELQNTSLPYMSCYHFSYTHSDYAYTNDMGSVLGFAEEGLGHLKLTLASNRWVRRRPCWGRSRPAGHPAACASKPDPSLPSVPLPPSSAHAVSVSDRAALLPQCYDDVRHEPSTLRTEISLICDPSAGRGQPTHLSGKTTVRVSGCVSAMVCIDGGACCRGLRSFAVPLGLGCVGVGVPLRMPAVHR
jgi:hypothetical protein